MSQYTFEKIETKTDFAPSFKINGITVHSLYNPIAEGKKWAESLMGKIAEKPERIIVFGLGFGYHIKELVKLLEERFGKIDINGNNDSIEIMVIEPSSGSLNFILQNKDKDLSELLKKSKIKLFEGMDNLETLRLNDAGLIFSELPAYKNIFSDSYDIIYKKYNIGQFFIPSSFKVLIVQPMYGGSSTIGNYAYKAFLNCGYDAKIMDFTKFYDAYKSLSDFTPNEDHIGSLRQMLVNLMSEALLSAVFSDRPDMVLFMAQAPATDRVIVKLKSMGIKTAYWFVEDFRTLTYWGSIAKHIDYFFTIQKGDFFKELEEMGLKNYYYLPLACLPDFHKKINGGNPEDVEKYSCAVSFAGAGYFNRRNAFSKLTEFNFKIWGSDWVDELPLNMFIQNGGRRFTEEEAVKIYNYSKININLHSSSWHWDINPNGDFLNPRVYEILGCGGFQLVDRRSYLRGVLEEGKDIVVFDSISDLKKKIKYYLEHEDERKAIAEHGYETVRKCHSYEHRVSEMMDIILINSYDSIKSKLTNRRENILKLLKETESNKELHELVSHFADKGSISIKDMVDYIKRGSGRLSKTEAMILMLWSVKSKLVTLD